MILGERLSHRSLCCGLQLKVSKLALRSGGLPRRRADRVVWATGRALRGRGQPGGCQCRGGIGRGPGRRGRESWAVPEAGGQENSNSAMSPGPHQSHRLVCCQWSVPGAETNRNKQKQEQTHRNRGDAVSRLGRWSPADARVFQHRTQG